ncbi:hypothetical protein ACLQ2S_23605 [Micromonospora sp. DT48]|uniref:hypothetical protein n=1 Tax=Micromonospora sp. DT48 TaxID=3393429 RepID=UPI003CEB3921
MRRVRIPATPSRRRESHARRRWLAGVLALSLWIHAMALAPARSTLAAWTDTEFGSAALAAGTVDPPTDLACMAGQLTPPAFTWDLPAGGVARSGFTWFLSDGFSGGGTLGSNDTSIVVPGVLLAVDTGTFTLYANGPGGWTSTPVTGSLGMLTDELYFCSVP